MARMRAVQVGKPGANFEVVERDVPDPAAGQVRIKVDACGICHSDMMVKEGYWPGLEYPRVPGHEVAGCIDAVGANIALWKVGQRVGVGWHGGHCFVCNPCREGDFIRCVNGKITGFSVDGGYADYMIAQAEAVAAMLGRFAAG
jgi:D-arabinose 1-dehydrogenase-like Zn-dependent alcohol dehydrogenase